MTYYNRYIKPNRVASSYGTTLPTGGVVFIPFLRINYFLPFFGAEGQPITADVVVKR